MLKVLRMVGEKAERFHDKIVRNVIVDSLELDELWARVHSRQFIAGHSNLERGDFYSFVGLESRSKLIVSHLTGKRNPENTEAFVKDLAARVFGIVQVTCDGWAPYVPAIKSFLKYRAHFCVMQKIYSTPDAGNEIIDPIRRYSPPRCTGVKVEIKAGEPDKDKIGTSYIERLNLTIRTHNRRFTRLCLGYSKKLENHRHAFALFVVAYNFTKRHSAHGKTPAFASGLATSNWTVDELVRKLAETI